MEQQIKGYRTLAPDEVDLVNIIKTQGDQLGEAIAALEARPGIDKRALAIAKTHLQTGQMWLVRSITQPEGF